MSRSNLNSTTPRRRHRYQPPAQSSYSSLSGQEPSYATHFERQQVENYPGHLVAGRYYLRPSSELSDLSRSHNGPGFALGSHPYRVDGVPARRRSHWLYEDTDLHSTTSESVLPPSPELAPQDRHNPPPSPDTSRNHFFGNVPWPGMSTVTKSETTLSQLYFQHVHGWTKLLLDTLTSLLKSVPRYLSSFLLVISLLLLIPASWSIFYHSLFLSSVNYGDPSHPKLKPFRTSMEGFINIRNGLLQQRRKLEVLSRTTPWLKSHQKQPVDQDQIFASLEKLVLKGLDDPTKLSLKFMLAPVVKALSEGRFLTVQGDLPSSWPPAVERESLSHLYSVLDFIEFDNDSGSYQLKSDIAGTSGAEMTGLARELSDQFQSSRDQWWDTESGSEEDTFLDHLQAKLYPIIKRQVDHLSSGQGPSLSHAKFIMTLHRDLRRESDVVSGNPTLLKVTGDLFTTLAAESVAQSPPAVTFNAPPATLEDQVNFMKLAITLLDHRKLESISRFDFALKTNGAKLVTWDVDHHLIDPPLAHPHPSKDRVVLNQDMKLGECWAYRAAGDQLSYLLGARVTLTGLALLHPAVDGKLDETYGPPPSSVQLYAQFPLTHPDPDSDEDHEWVLITEGAIDWTRATLETRDDHTYLHAPLPITWLPTHPATHRFRLTLGPPTTPSSPHACLYHAAFYGTLPPNSPPFEHGPI